MSTTGGSRVTHRTRERDVVVVGGGTSGFAAAVAAARNGANVLLIESEDHLGGTLSGAFVLGICSLRHQRISTLQEFPLQETDYSGEQAVLGIAQEFVDRMIRAQAAWGTVGKSAVRQLLDPEIAKWVIDQMAIEAGVEVWLYSTVVDVLKCGNRVTGVVVENASGRTEVPALVTIDATGDGHVAVRAGASFEQGRSDDGLCQAMSLYFVIGGVQIEKTLDYLSKHADEFGRGYVDAVLQLYKSGLPLTLLNFKSKMLEAISNGDYPIPYGADRVIPEAHFGVARPLFRNGKVRYEMTGHNVDMAYRVDATDPIQLSNAMIAMRDIAVKMAAFYRKYIPGYEDSYLVQTAQRIGVRETRRIVGDYVLTGDDVLQGKTFADAVGRYAGAVDIHDADGGKAPIRLTEIGGSGWYHVPYRIMLPQGVDSLFVVGRCVSTDRVANGSIRGQGGCMITGQAAGTAAAVASKKGVGIRDVDIKELQRLLVSQGVVI